MDAPCIIVLSTSKNAAAVGSAGGVSAASTSAAAQPAIGSTRRVAAERVPRRRPGWRAMRHLRSGATTPSARVAGRYDGRARHAGRHGRTDRAAGARHAPDARMVRAPCGSVEKSAEQVAELAEQATVVMRRVVGRGTRVTGLGLRAGGRRYASGPAGGYRCTGAG